MPLSLHIETDVRHNEELALKARRKQLLTEQIEALELKNEDRISAVLLSAVSPEHYSDILTIIKLESGGDSLAYYQGNYGLMQINKVHFHQVNRDSIYCLEYNLKVGYELYLLALAKDYKNRFAWYNRSPSRFLYQKKAYNILNNINYLLTD